MTPPKDLEAERELSVDIHRAILLSQYIKNWGQPSQRTKSRHRDNLSVVEVYEFPPCKDEIYRIATIGISNQLNQNGKVIEFEFLLCLPESLGGVESIIVVYYLLDIMAYSLRSEVHLKIGATIPESVRAPKEWNTKAILFDEARGEPEDMSCLSIGQKTINLFWLVPLTESERKYIKDCGLKAFDNVVQESDWSLIDVNRESII